MIGRDEVMSVLGEACPSFGPAWAEGAEENIEGGERLAYLDAGDFIRHLVRLQLAGETTEFPAVFAVIERLAVEGDEYVTNLAVIGYLEGLQMMAVTGAGIDPEVTFRPLLGPVSERWWARINRFWDGDHAALEVDEP